MLHIRRAGWFGYGSSVLTLVALAACSEPATSPVRSFDDAVAPHFALSSGQDAVVVQSEAGAGFWDYVANNSQRLTSEFWDNFSADNYTTLTCNVGFYASHTMLAGCGNVTPGSYENMPTAGIYTQYWGDTSGPGNKDASAFMMSGTYSYNTKMLGAFHGIPSTTVGYFTKLGSSYSFYPVPAWQTVGASYVVNTGGLDWGFYITNSFNPALGGCSSPDTDCSDATGSFSSMQYQQFALFSNVAGTKFLVGMEDNRLNLLPGNSLPEDSDYQDYILSVEPIVRTIGTRGCSPGYWKNHNFPTNGTYGYSKTQKFLGTTYDGSPLFGDAFGSTATLQGVLSDGGGGLTALGRQTVSAFFNAVVFSDFKYSPDAVINLFNAAAAGTAGDRTKLQNEFESLTDVNGRTCNNPTGK